MNPLPTARRALSTEPDLTDRALALPPLARWRMPKTSKWQSLSSLQGMRLRVVSCPSSSQKVAHRPKAEAALLRVFLTEDWPARSSAVLRSALKRARSAGARASKVRPADRPVQVGKEGIVREVLEARGVVCHHVGWSWDVEGLVAIAVSALMETGIVAN